MMMLKIFVFGTLISSVYTVCSESDSDACLNEVQQSLQGINSGDVDAICSKLRQYENCLYDRCPDVENLRELVTQAFELQLASYGVECDLDNGQDSPRMVVMSASFLLVALVVVRNFFFKF
ncbi:hypothetical protein RRG08_007413 [Elysia crispata]|uniref:Uncharacterized protein n=1 Tax=Elysia crispata TaxID=231223 RepID=A0AAE0ZYY2_9GAST|nr:hypothetical protein RRG08_007413 [Elysia crispata]